MFLLFIIKNFIQQELGGQNTLILYGNNKNDRFFL